MGVDLNQFAIDPDTYENGVTLPLGGKSNIVIRSASSRHAIAVLDRILQPYRSLKTFPDDLSDELDAAWCAEGLIVTWNEILVDSEKVEFSVESAKEILGQRRFSSLRAKIIRLAREESNFQAEQDEEAEGN